MVELVRKERDAPPPDPQNLIELVIPEACEEMVVGAPAPKKRRIFVQTDDRIQQIVEGGLANRTALEFLRGIAQNFNMDA